MSKLLERAVCGRWVLAALVGCAALLATGARADVVINEVLADNTDTYMDDDGNFPDLVELYNYSVSTVDISGWKLTDDPLTNKYTFPAGTVMFPFNYLIVFCDTATNLGGIHTGFGLGRKGSYLRLTNNIVPGRGDSLTFGLQLADYSVGRIPNGAGSFVLNTPTIGFPNVSVAVGPTNGLRINEWAATNTPAVGSTGPGLDWLELYNPSNSPVNISGLVFTSMTPPTNNLLYGVKPLRQSFLHRRQRLYPV